MTTDKIDIRSKLHEVIGYLRRNEWINAHDLVVKMSKQMDEEYYNAKPIPCAPER